MSQSPSPAETSQTAQSASKAAGPFWLSALLRPIQDFRLNYLPLAMIYFAYGALGLIDVSRDMWIKERLTLSPAELAGIAVWLSLPWTVKMVFGELVDCVPIFGSQRKAYVLIGAAATASGMLTLAGAAGGWIAFALSDAWRSRSAFSRWPDYRVGSQACSRARRFFFWGWLSRPFRSS